MKTSAKLPKLEINENLRQEILSTIPQNYTKLERMIKIYFELCKRVEYSMSFFMHDVSAPDYYMAPKNLKDIDGKTRKDVVCYTYSAILAKLLIDANVCDENWLEESGVFERNGLLGTEYHHKKLEVKIGKNTYELDAIDGFYSDTGLNVANVFGEIEGICCIDGDSTPLKKAIKKVQEHEKKDGLRLEAEYIKLKEQDGSLQKFSLEERKNLFLEMATSKNVPHYSLYAFFYYYKLKHLLFEASEYKKHIDKKIELVFVKDNYENDLKALFLFNTKGYTNDKGYENFKSLEIYQLSPQQNSIEKLGLRELRKRCKERYVSDIGGYEPEIIMARQGEVHVEFMFSDTDPCKVEGYVRHFLKDDKRLPSDRNGRLIEEEVEI